MLQALRHSLSSVPGSPANAPAGKRSFSSVEPCPRRVPRRVRRISERAERHTIRIARGKVHDPDYVREMILADPGIVEEGLRVLDGNLQAGTGDFIDLVASDASGSLVLLEIERENEDELLVRLLDHYAWVVSQIRFLRRVYGSSRVSPLRSPRVVALSHRFSPRFMERLAYLRFSATPLLYRVLTADGEPGLYLEAAEAGPEREESHDLPPAGAEAERLSAEELEAFYRFEHDRERRKEGAGD